MMPALFKSMRSAAMAARVGLLAAAMLCASPAMAGEGHDHGDAPPAVVGNGPKRQADGSVFLPKPAQRQIGVRTALTVEAAWPSAFVLTGKVVMDPNAGGRVQAAIAGRLEAGPSGLPSLGQAVRQGQVLAHVVPTPGAIEQANQQAQQAELRASLRLAESRLSRLQALSDTVARKDIEAAAAEVISLRERLKAVSAGLSRRDALVAPVSGVIASANAVAGQVLQPGDQVFEVVDPNRLRIEALAYEPAQARQIGSASLLVGGARVPLRFMGAARRLREQALPLLFAAESPLPQGHTLALGQVLQVFAQTRDSQRGMAVPAASLVKSPSNQDTVWVKVAPERFEPRVVTHAPMDGVQVRLSSGVKVGELVVTQGASLINQVR
ncbi:efflux RND transporter periplasmic adaptor subunit [Aquabacterium sp.]|uniref:efflux RND transporter periplasmic adaptor subunit n=1 Tax=Aquabacterium sp. TaxID=1872578 RepID=UPI0039C86499